VTLDEISVRRNELDTRVRSMHVAVETEIAGLFSAVTNRLFQVSCYRVSYATVAELRQGALQARLLATVLGVVADRLDAAAARLEPVDAEASELEQAALAERT